MSTRGDVGGAVDCDVLVVGAGAAGLLAALAARGALGPDGAAGPAAPGAPEVVLVNATAKVGLKILASGGGRCNVTNERVDEHDFTADAPHVLRGLLRAWPVARTRRLFEARGVALYAEPMGKLFPVTDRARDVVDALLGAVREAGVRLLAPADVTALAPPTPAPVGAEGGAPGDDDAGARAGGVDCWTATLACGPDGADRGGADRGGADRDGRRTGDLRAVRARRVVLATGGLSLPRTGSRGFGLDWLARRGHTVEPPLPALTPLLLDPAGPLAGHAGLTHPTLLTLAPRGAPPEQVAGARFRPLARAAGSLLVTHQGASGPAALDVSGACGRALAAGQAVTLEADVWTLPGDAAWAPFRGLAKAPGACLPPADAPRPTAREAFVAAVREAAGERSIGAALAQRVPRALAHALLERAGVDPGRLARGLDPGAWARAHRAVCHADLGLRGTDGYAKAEVTAGGVLLGELDRTTLESRRLPGLFACGEVVAVTGRLGGFNFQWAWASGAAAGQGARASLARSPAPRADRDAGGGDVGGCA